MGLVSLDTSLNSWKEDLQAMVGEVALRPGTKVRLRDLPIGVTLRTLGGMIEQREFDDDDYYLVRLDEPATYHNTDGSTEELKVIREAGDNLVVSEPGRS